jgi:hypothetical protein
MSKIASVDESTKQGSLTQQAQETEVADFTGEALSSNLGLPSPGEQPYNPNRDRENVRSFVAKGLLILLLGTVVVSFVCLSAGWINKDDLKK